jgi:hypothetical protein
MKRRLAMALGAAGMLALWTAGLAQASGAGTVSITQQSRNVVLFSAPGFTDPCNSLVTGTLTATAATEVFHVTFQADGTFWVTGTAEGTVTFTPDIPGGVSAIGHFMNWFGESSNDKNDVQHDTSTFNLQASDGTHIVLQMVDHFSTNALGQVTVSFSNASTRCG